MARPPAPAATDPDAAGSRVPGPPEPRWLDPDEQRAWRTLISTTYGLFATLDRELQAEHGISLGEYEVLAVLSEASEWGLRMHELASTLHISPSGMTRRVDGMVRRGLLRREQCPEDRRGSYARLTDDGRALLRQAAPTHVAGVRRHFIDRLTRRQLEQLAAALDATRTD